MRRLIVLLLSFQLWGTPAHAFIFGGGLDIPYLIKIVANTAHQLVALRNLIGNGVDTLNYLHDLNAGIREAMSMMQTMNKTLSPGIFSDLGNLEELLRTIESLYGKIPATSEAGLQKTHDQSAAEAIHLHNEAFRYAQSIDPEAERIKEYARYVSPLGAQRLTAQSVALLVHVLTQVLRTNAAMLKLQSEQLALNNRQQKLNSEHFKMQYEGLSRAFGELKPTFDLPSLTGRR